MEWPTALELVLAGLRAGVFALVAVALGRRRTDADVQPALTRFRLWWACVALLSLAELGYVVLYVRGWLSLWLYETFVETFVLVACIGLWALLCYLIFTYSGKRTWWWPLGWFYGAMYAFVIGVMHHAGPPEALELVAGRVRPVGVQPLPALTNLAIFLFLLGPQVVAAAAYAFLYTKAQTRTQRYRILLVSGGLLAWLGFVLLRGVAQAEGVGWRLLGQGVGLVAALLVLLAYFPPALLQRRWGLDTIGGDARAASG